MSLNSSYRTIMDPTAKPKALRNALCDWFFYGLVIGLACVVFDDSIYSTIQMAIAYSLVSGVLSVGALLLLRNMKV
jgi:hypothetical protein